MTNRVVLITGITGGLGQVLAHLLHDKGMTVYGTSRSADARIENVNMLRLHITDSGSITRCLDTIIEKEGKIDVVINCINKLVIGSVEETPVEDFREVMETNVIGSYDLGRQSMGIFQRQNSGLLINMSSAGGIIAIPYFASYTAAKFAVETWSEALYHELRDSPIDVVIMQPVAMYMDRPSTGKHIELASLVGDQSKSHLMVDKMAKDTAISPLTPEMVSRKIYDVIAMKSKRPLRVRMGRSKQLAIIKRIAPQGLINYMLKRELPV